MRGEVEVASTMLTPGQVLLRKRGARRAAGSAVILLLGGAILWGLQRATLGVNFDAVVIALRAIQTSTLLVALAATVVSYGALLGYDISGLRYAGARLPLRTVLLASVCGYAIGNAVGLGALSGGAVRYRVYTAAGLSPGQIARVICFISAAIGLGLATIAGLGLILRLDQVSQMLGTARAPIFGAAATALILATVLLVFCATRREPLVLGSIAIEPPGPKLILTQVVLTAIDIFAAATVLWTLLPPTGIGFFAFAAVYAAALALGMLSHVPGGLGVFEVAILYAVGSKAPVNDVAAALVAYRAVYYLLPLFFSTVLLAGFEARRSLGGVVGERIGRAATRLAPSFLAAATFAVGAILVVSGAIPVFIGPLQVLRLHVPLWAVETSHLLASIAGLILLFTARGLLHRLDGAWWVASSMALLSIPFSLVRGLTVMAPTVAMVLLLGLILARRQFDRRASLLSQPLTAGWLVAIASVVIAMIWIVFFAFRDVGYADQLWWQFELDAAASRALRAVLAVALLGLALGIWQLLRPATGRLRSPGPAELTQARRITARQRRPDALLAMMGDKSLLFSDSGNSFLMFGKHGRTWAALGDPVGPADDWGELVWRFIELADAHGDRVAFYQIPPASLPLYLDAGLKVIKLGEVAQIPLARFTLEGGARSNLRYAVKRGERDGLTFGVIEPASVSSIIGELEEISKAWLAKHAAVGEKQFSVAAFEHDFVMAQPVALVRERGRAVAFATVMTTDLDDEVTVGLMRLRPDTSSNHTMEYLFVRLLQYFRERDYHSFSLGMAPLSGFGTHPLASRWYRLARFIWSHGHRFYNFRGLRNFKSKFDPEWEPRYLAASGLLGPYFALADIAALVNGGFRRRRETHRRASKLRLAKVLCFALAASFLTPSSASALDTGDLGEVRVVNPDGAMHGLVVLFSDSHGWTARSDKIAGALAHAGALVVGVDLPAYFRRLDTHPAQTCFDAVSDIELISRQIQRARGNAKYRTPILAGVGEGGAFAAATLAQAPADTIAGAASVDPTASLQTRLAPCSRAPGVAGPNGGFSYGPWKSLPGFWVVGFRSAADSASQQRVQDLQTAGTPVEISKISAESSGPGAMITLLQPRLGRGLGPSNPAISGLPLVELPASPHGPLLAIIFSGDGGWRDLDKTIGEKLQSDGVSVVGWDSLRYFWSHKSPEQTARDLSAVIDTYSARWGTSKVALIGYSFGAGVLPFAYDRLSPEAKLQVVQLSLLGFGTAADFEISLRGWLGAPPTKKAVPTEPALAHIDPSMIQCFYGKDENDSACPSLAAKQEVTAVETDGGHHFNGDYGSLAQRILDGFRRRAG